MNHEPNHNPHANLHDDIIRVLVDNIVTLLASGSGQRHGAILAVHLADDAHTFRLTDDDWARLRVALSDAVLDDNDGPMIATLVDCFSRFVASRARRFAATVEDLPAGTLAATAQTDSNQVLDTSRTVDANPPTAPCEQSGQLPDQDRFPSCPDRW